MLVCAMNPCKCGYYGHPKIKCTCRPDEIRKYMSRISGPLLDRIDIQVEVPALDFEDMARKGAPSESSLSVRQRVEAARAISEKRFRSEGKSGGCNAELDTVQIQKYCALDEEGKQIMRMAYDKFGISARGYDRILRLARTIADLAGRQNVSASDIAEAVQYRTLDRKYKEI